MRDWAENQVTTAWIRHGETKANRERRYLGRTDEPLSEEGRQTLLARRKTGCYPKADYLFCSPMKRCLETAQILYPDLRPVFIDEWKEMDFGRFELKNYRELKEDPEYQAWIDSGGTLPFPEGESREAFILRCEAGFHKMCQKLDRLREKDKRFVTVASIVHGGTIMALLSRYCGGDYYDYQVLNGGGYLCFPFGKITGSI